MATFAFGFILGFLGGAIVVAAASAMFSIHVTRVLEEVEDGFKKRE